MAIMIPSVISPEVKSNAERRIFEWFKAAPGTDNWIVLHSLGIATHNRVIYGETDFLVLAPNLGIFALEVKGGRVRRERGGWYFTNRYNQTNSKSRGPFEQAREGIFSIMSALKKRTNSEHRAKVASILFSYGVMFPDIEFEAGGIEEEQWQVFDLRDSSDVKSFIVRLANGAKMKWEEHYGPADQSKLPDVSDIKYIASLLRGDFDCTVPMSLQLRNANAALIALTKEQYRCLDQLDDNPRCLIQGAAGTGKTLLAIEEAKKSVAQGNRTALFCFNANLADWLSNYFAGVPQSLRPQFVGTFHKFTTQLAREANLLPSYPEAPERVQQYYQKDIPEAAVTALRGKDSLFDKIIVDESQDLMQDRYLDVMDMCLSKGLTRGRWTMFGDFSMQAIYTDGLSGPQLLEKLDDRCSFIRFKLTINCRNTKPICSEIEIVTGFKAPNELWTKVEGPPVQYITWTTMDDQQKKLQALLGQLVEKRIPPEQITILSPKKKCESVVSLINGYTIRDFKVPPGNSITFCTIQGYKGLENTIVILTDIEGYSADKLMYVGLSRACSALFVFETEQAKGEYDALLMRRLLNE